MSRIIVVIPCYNEAQRLNTRCLLEFIETSPRVDLLLVNDGSRDATLDILEHLHEANSNRFSFLHLPSNRGKAEAIRQGMLLALRSQPSYLGFWDADLATPLEQLTDFIRVLDSKPQIDVVIGTRMVLLGRTIRRRRIRAALGRAFSWLAARALATPIRDTQCGAKLFRLTPDFVAALGEPYLSRWIFDVEIFARLHRARQLGRRGPLAESIYEQPLDAWCDTIGSKLKPLDMLKAGFELGRIYWTYRWPRFARHWGAPVPASAATAAATAAVRLNEAPPRGDAPARKAA